MSTTTDKKTIIKFTKRLTFSVGNFGLSIIGACLLYTICYFAIDGFQTISRWITFPLCIVFAFGISWIVNFCIFSRAAKKNLLHYHHVIEVGGLEWSSELLSGGSGIVNPDNGIYYYTQPNAIAEADKQGLRLPTQNEYKHFHDQTTHEWIERDGQLGMLFIDKENGNSIFFPAVGSCSDEEVYFEFIGINGFYWNSSKVDNMVGCNMIFWDDVDHIDIGDINHIYNRFPVRCVLK